jgi:hypothetical protein
LTRGARSAGLTVFCADDDNEKVACAFRAVDSNEDGYLDLLDLKRYLTAVYSVLCAINPAALSGLEPQDVAAATARRALVDSGAGPDGYLSISGFRRWYTMD